MELIEPLRYDNHHDVEMRLHSSIVRYQGFPVLCRCAPDHFDGLGIRLKKITSNKWGEYIHSSDVELDISSPPLGYINVEDFAAYLTRIPYRKQKQGISSDNTTWHSESPATTNLWSALNSKAYADTVLNVYPDGEQGLHTLRKKENVFSVAIHRKFALVKDELGLVKLKNMGTPIGWIVPQTSRVIIKTQLHNPIFEEELNAIGLECIGD